MRGFSALQLGGLQIRRVFLVPAGVLLISGLLFAVSGDPSPIEPPQFLFNRPNVQGVLAAANRTPPSNDFSSRPLMRSDRLPPVLEAESVEPLVQTPPDQPMESIDGVTLVGIFGSGDVKGIIVRLENGERQRLVVGASLKGWILDWVGPRQAVFIASRGAGQAQLDMAFAEIKPLPVSEERAAVRSAPREGKQASSPDQQVASPAAEAALAIEEPAAAPASFGAAYRERRLRRQREEQANQEPQSVDK